MICRCGADDAKRPLMTYRQFDSALFVGERDANTALVKRVRVALLTN